MRFLKQKLPHVNWNEVIRSKNASKPYVKFSEKLDFKIRLNQRKNLYPWITKFIRNSSKRKQKLYKKFSKKQLLLMKQPTKLLKVYSRQFSVSPKKTLPTKDTPIQT